MRGSSSHRWWLLSIVAFALLFTATLPVQAQRNTGPWDMQRLSEPPANVEWGERQEDPERGIAVREVYYQSEPFEGHPTRVYAWYAEPLEAEGPLPAMVLVHGGGGRAFREWAELWAERGYAALAMDTAGGGPEGQRLEDGGPNQNDATKFRDFTDDEVDQMWTYHAVAAVVRGHSLLASLEQVDADRIGITGISWGGYLTCIVAGIDERLKVAVPVYGCGFIHEDSCWVEGWFDKMSAEQRQRWVTNFDPSQYLGGVTCPILFMNGTNDFAYPLNSFDKSVAEVPEREYFDRVEPCIRVRMPHGHPQGWAPAEIVRFADYAMRDEALPPAVRITSREGRELKGEYSGEVAVVSAELHFAPSTGAWKDRQWETVEANLEDYPVSQGIYSGAITGELPENAENYVWFLSVTDEEGYYWSSRVVIPEE